MINIIGWISGCNNCGRGELSAKGHSTISNCQIFQNVEYCTSTPEQQSRLKEGMICAITRKPLNYGYLLGYKRDEERNEVAIIDKDSYYNMKKCRWCDKNEIMNKCVKLSEFINRDDHIMFVCNNCRHHLTDTFFGSKFRMLKGRNKKLNPFSRYVGIEIETVQGDDFNYLSLPANLKGLVRSEFDGSIYDSSEYGEEDEPNSPVNNNEYEQDEDRSDRGNGREFVTIPMAHDKLFQVIDELCEFLKKKNCQINKSCGFHCHLDMKKENYHNVRKTFLVFSIFEDVLFNMLPESRRTSRYCLPLKKDYRQFFNTKGRNEQRKFENYWFETNNKDTIEHKKKHKWDESRYVSINYHSLFFHGTLENRQHSGTLSATKMKNWILINQILTDYAIHTPMKRLMKLRGNVETFHSIIQSYERKFPILETYNLVGYSKHRISLFSEKDIVGIRVSDEIKTNPVEKQIAMNNLSDMIRTKTKR